MQNTEANSGTGYSNRATYRGNRCEAVFFTDPDWGDCLADAVEGRWDDDDRSPDLSDATFPANYPTGEGERSC